MTGFEYKVVPAPMRGLKAKGVKGTPARFANALETVMNEWGAQGWEYQRTDTLPVEERQGLTGKATSFQNMLVFRRAVMAQEAPQIAALIEDQSERGEAASTIEDDTLDEDTAPPAKDVATKAADMPSDGQNGSVELADGTDLADSPEQSDGPAQNGDTASQPEDPIAARDRVSETLSAQTPFVFPWNRRRSAADADTDARLSDQ